MKLPGNIPVAAESLEALMRIGNPWLLRANAEALVVVTNDPVDPCIVWASPKLKSYRSVWDSAAAKGRYRPRLSQELGQRARQHSAICAPLPGVGRS